MYYWVPVVTGFVLGALVIFISDFIIQQFRKKNFSKTSKGENIDFERSTLLVIAITIHDIPEGLAIGVSFDAASLGIPAASIAAAISLTVGIGLQKIFLRYWQYQCL